jgi:hypothetical protein
MQNGIPLNAETARHFLEQYGFGDIQVLSPGTTTMDPEWVSNLDLFERAGHSVYIECRKI